MQLDLLHLFENEEQSTLNNEWYKVSIGDSKKKDRKETRGLWVTSVTWSRVSVSFYSKMFKWIIKLFQKLYCKIPIYSRIWRLYIKRYMYLKKSLPFWHHILRYKMHQTTNFTILGLNVLLEIKKSKLNYK